MMPEDLRGGTSCATGPREHGAPVMGIRAWLTAYLLADGERIYDWTVRYLPQDHRVRVRQALPEISRIVSDYLLGQLLTSLLFGGFTYVVLTVLGVPQAPCWRCWRRWRMRSRWWGWSLPPRRRYSWR